MRSSVWKRIQESEKFTTTEEKKSSPLLREIHNHREKYSQLWNEETRGTLLEFPRNNAEGVPRSGPRARRSMSKLDIHSLRMMSPQEVLEDFVGHSSFGSNRNELWDPPETADDLTLGTYAPRQLNLLSKRVSQVESGARST